jgi:hypothetical protein
MMAGCWEAAAEAARIIRLRSASRIGAAVARLRRTKPRPKMTMSNSPGVLEV